MKILLVEDNAICQRFVTKSLQELAGFECSLCSCETLGEALDHLVTSEFDVLLLDLSLPDSDGLETVTRVIAAAPQVPVVVMTATDDRTVATEALRCGAQDYLVKGLFPGSAIARVMQYAIDRHQFRRELSQQSNHFQQVLNHVPAVVWTTDFDLRITSSFGAGSQALRISQDQVLGKTLEEYFTANDEPERTIKAHQRALSGQSVSFEGEWLGRIFEVKVDPLHLPERQIAGTVGVAIDVTDRRILDREISFARLVQEALLPDQHPRLAGFDIFGASHPAKQTSGDWYDYLMFPDGSLGLVVGDVSSKGFGPAIMSATIAAYLEVLAEIHSDLKVILDFCNRMVCKRSADGQFAVLALARLQAGQQTLTYGGAGEGMLVVSRDGRLKHTIASSGFPLGLVDEVGHDAPAQIPLDAGDVLLLLTDGFRESFTPDGNLFGTTRIIETVAQHAHESASEIFQALLDAANEFSDGARQSDDQTGIIVKVLDT